ncbi:MAG: molybdopterin-dependent oxidoreductase [Chloroflexota bacterium]
MTQKAAERITEDVWVSTQCTMCYGNCPIRVHRVNGVAVAIEGEPDCAASEGRMCVKGVAGLQLLYDPNRLNYPMKRTNPQKGIGIDPQWQRISWDEALDTIAQKFKEVYQGDPKQLHCQIIPSPSPLGRLMQSFTIAFGGSYASGGGGVYCGNSTHFVCNRVHGAWSFLPDYQYCNYILHFGSSKGHGAGHTAVYTQVQAADARARGAKVVSFDPVCSMVGSKAAEWVPILPGSDSAVALAMVNVILNELGTYDVEHIKKRTNGPFLIGPDEHYVRDPQTKKPLVWDATEKKAKAFDDPSVGDYAIEGEYEYHGIKCHPAFALLKEHVRQYTPEFASQASTAPAETIRRIAREFAQAASIGSTITIQGKTLPLRPAAAITFRGAQGHTNGFHNVIAVYLLNAIVGSDDVPGGAIGWPTQFYGLPQTGYPRYEASSSEDGDLIPGWWHTAGHPMWPIHEPKVPATDLTLRSVFPWVGSIPFIDAADRQWWLEKFGLSTKKKKILINWGCNTIMSMPDKDTMAESLKEWGYIVSFRLYLDEFSDFADIVLPDTCYLETLYPSPHIEVGFCGQPGMADWFFNIKQPVVKPLFERVQAAEVCLKLAKRISPKLLADTYHHINRALRLRDPYKLELDASKDYTWEEICDRTVKSFLGDEYGLEWFKEHHGINWPKKVDEVYFAPFVKNLRQPIYWEFIIGMRERTRAVCEPVGVDIDWRYYTPWPSYFPCLETKEPGEHDLFGITYRHVLHTGSVTMEIPYIDELSQSNPYVYHIQIHADTARKKGLRDGDRVILESDTGGKTEGTIKTMQAIHPQVVAVNACAGHWSPNLPIAKGKGTHFNDLLRMDKEHLDPVTFSIEAAARLKIYKKEQEGGG